MISRLAPPQTLAQEMEVIDADAIVAALKTARKSLATAHKAELLATYESLASDAPYAVEST